MEDESVVIEDGNNVNVQYTVESPNDEVIKFTREDNDEESDTIEIQDLEEEEGEGELEKIDLFDEEEEEEVVVKDKEEEDEDDEEEEDEKKRTWGSLFRRILLNLILLAFVAGILALVCQEGLSFAEDVLQRQIPLIVCNKESQKSGLDNYCVFKKNELEKILAEESNKKKDRSTSRRSSKKKKKPKIILGKLMSSCDETSKCEDGLVCFRGICLKPSEFKTGYECESDDQCESNVCEEGKCEEGEYSFFDVPFSIVTDYEGDGDIGERTCSFLNDMIFEIFHGSQYDIVLPEFVHVSTASIDDYESSLFFEKYAQESNNDMVVDFRVYKSMNDFDFFKTYDDDESDEFIKGVETFEFLEVLNKNFKKLYMIIGRITESKEDCTINKNFFLEERTKEFRKKEVLGSVYFNDMIQIIFDSNDGKMSEVCEQVNFENLKMEMFLFSLIEHHIMNDESLGIVQKNMMKCFEACKPKMIDCKNVIEECKKFIPLKTSKKFDRCDDDEENKCDDDLECTKVGGDFNVCLPKDYFKSNRRSTTTINVPKEEEKEEKIEVVDTIRLLCKKDKKQKTKKRRRRRSGQNEDLLKDEEKEQEEKICKINGVWAFIVFFSVLVILWLIFGIVLFIIWIVGKILDFISWIFCCVFGRFRKSGEKVKGE